MSVRRLDPILIDRIAAGEVIERPAAVIKELVENAIDAGSRRIDVRIDDGGRSLIRVTDDGSGMGPDDLELAVERHATSKLPDGDLTQIATLGFRGEALPSIASVARLEVITRPIDGANGWLIAIDAGVKGAVKPASIMRGTRVEVRDLFYATPARLKFLKSDRAEAQAVAGMLKRLAMARPEIRFSLAGEGTAGFDYAAAGSGPEGLLVRLAQILGAEFRDNAIEIDAERHGVWLKGFAGLPTFHRAASTEQYLFVNGRPVRDKLLLGAIRGAYADYLPGDRHPVVALFIDVEPAAVDVNVHPAKAEVRFREGGAVRGLIVGALRERLAIDGIRSATTGGARTIDRLAARAGGSVGYGASWPARAPSGGWSWQDSPAFPGNGGFSENQQADFEGFSTPEARANVAEDSAEVGKHPLGAARAQLHDTYIVAQTGDGIVIVDQHAAHERLVYERLKRQRAESAISRQMLLIPAIVEIDEAAVARLLEAASALETLGLVLEGFGPGAIAVREVPTAIAGGDIPELVRDIADSITEWGGPLALERAVDHVLATFACHHSVRAGRRMRPEEMNALLREMETTPGSGQCNHGRPTYVELKLNDVERLFGRR